MPESSRLDKYAVDLAQASVMRLASSPAPLGGQAPWVERTAEVHTFAGVEWCVVIDWAQRSDGQRVPAAVTLSSLGGTYTDTPAPNIEPSMVTRAVVESVPWGKHLSKGREDLRTSMLRTIDPAAYPEVTTHDELLRKVAEVYTRQGGTGNRTIAEDVKTQLELEGVRIKPRANNPSGELTAVRVRRWISEAGRRGYIPSLSLPTDSSGSSRRDK